MNNPGTNNPGTEFSFLAHLSELKNGPREYDLSANKEEREALAQRFSLPEIKSLKGHLKLYLSKGNKLTGPTVSITGDLTCNLVQTCVVSLENFKSTIKSDLGGLFVTIDPEIDEDLNEENKDEKAIDIIGEIIDEAIDIGDFLAEQMGLELDPFPRKPGATFDGFGDDNNEEEPEKKPNPFAVLEKLKDNM